MARRVVLLVSSDQPRLHAWQTGVRRAGYLPLPAPSARRAMTLTSKVRPSMVVVDGELGDGGALELLRELRGAPRMEHVPVVLLGAVTPELRDELARDPQLQAAQVDDDGIAGVLETALGGPRPTPRRGRP